MKTMRMTREFAYQPKPSVCVLYLAGMTYERVPEFAARAIVAAGAGCVVPEIMDQVEDQFKEIFC